MKLVLKNRTYEMIETPAERSVTLYKIFGENRVKYTTFVYDRAARTWATKGMILESYDEKLCGFIHRVLDCLKYIYINEGAE